MTEKVAIISGITGQDGSYLARLLLAKGYVVHGIVRPSSLANTQRIDDLVQIEPADDPRVVLHFGDMTDTSSLIRLIEACAPDEVYNLAAQSHVAVSFETPEYTANADALGPLRLLEAIRIAGLCSHTRYYQASTSELFGHSGDGRQSERTPFAPRSPYAAAKLYAYWITVNYRQAYAMHCSNGILFNHESPLRGETFVSRKITRGVAAIACGLQSCLYLGNLDARRDWGHARDYVDGIWRTLQQPTPGDYVLATGETRSVRDFVEHAFARIGRQLVWQGEGVDEEGMDRRTGEVLVRVDPAYLRPTDVDTLCGDASKARRVLGWAPTITFDQIVAEMVDHDLKLAAGTSGGRTVAA